MLFICFWFLFSPLSYACILKEQRWWDMIEKEKKKEQAKTTSNFIAKRFKN